MNGQSDRRALLRSVSLVVLALALSSSLLAAQAGRSNLNFVFILIDDMGWTDAGCYGSTFYETPHVDHLASEGMRFTDAYAACPVCSPTRASILAGKYPARLHLTNWFYGDIRKQLMGPRYVRQLPLAEVTLAEAFKAVGYATFLAGKWHLGGKSCRPEDQGFDVFVNKGNLGQTWRGHFTVPGKGKAKVGFKRQYLADRLTDESVKFLEQNRDKPFLLYLSHHAVHTPLQAKEEYVRKYERKAAKLPPTTRPRFLPEGDREARQVQDHAVYAGMIQSMDESVGRVMAKLDALGLADRTVVIFMSDNGGLSTSEGHPTANVPLRAGKGWLYEGGIREPMIIKWPGVVKPGIVCREPVISTDFYPTMLEMAGLPLRREQHADGVSLVPLLKGRRSLDREALFWHYPHYSPQGGRPSAAVRAGDYKLIEFYEDRHVELYNLKQDIGEKHDLATRMPDKTAELRAKLHAWQKGLDARMPTPNPEWKQAMKGKTNAR